MGFLSWIDGYKTYISAFGFLIYGIFQISNDNIPGGVQSILQALTAAGLRHAVSKV